MKTSIVDSASYEIFLKTFDVLHLIKLYDNKSKEKLTIIYHNSVYFSRKLIKFKRKKL